MQNISFVLNIQLIPIIHSELILTRVLNRKQIPLFDRKQMEFRRKI